jgi:hypothetical protein
LSIRESGFGSEMVVSEEQPQKQASLIEESKFGS